MMFVSGMVTYTILLCSWCNIFISELYGASEDISYDSETFL
jgi:hypothetical protein